MKRKILAIMLLSVMILFILPGCGCTNLEKLSFSNAFNGGNAPNTDFTEKLTYSVSFLDDSQNHYGVSDVIKSAVEREYTDGKYVSELKVFSVIEENEIKEKCTYLLDDISFYRLTTSFSIKVKYVFKNEVYEHTDTINSTVYFYPSKKYFAPVYSSTTSDQYIMILNDTNLSLTHVIAENEIIYGEKEYSVNKSAKEYNLNGEQVNLTNSADSYGYEFGTVIDNAELLFALRNFNVESGQKTLPVVEASYGKYTSLLINNNAQKEMKINMELNDENKEYTVKYNDVSFRVDNNKASGAPQKIAVQKESEGLANLSLLLSYTRPIITAGNIAYAGTLQFTLTKVER